MNTVRIQLSSSRAVAVAFVLGLALFGTVATADADHDQIKPFESGDGQCHPAENSPSGGPAANGPEGHGADNRQPWAGPPHLSPNDCGNTNFRNPCDEQEYPDGCPEDEPGRHDG